MQDHRVGDVRHVEFVEADEPVALGDPLAQLVERIHGALQLTQFAVHLAHELVKVQPRLALQRHSRVESSPSGSSCRAPPAKHVDTARNLGLTNSFFRHS